MSASYAARLWAVQEAIRAAEADLMGAALHQKDVVMERAADELMRIANALMDHEARIRMALARETARQFETGNRITAYHGSIG